MRGPPDRDAPDRRPAVLLARGVARWLAAVPLGLVVAIGSVSADGGEVPFDVAASLVIGAGCIASSIALWTLTARRHRVSAGPLALAVGAAVAVLVLPSGATLAVALVVPLAVAGLGRAVAAPAPVAGRVAAVVVGAAVAVPAALLTFGIGRMVAALAGLEAGIGDGVVLDRAVTTVGFAFVVAVTEAVIVTTVGAVLRITGRRSAADHG